MFLRKLFGTGSNLTSGLSSLCQNCISKTFTCVGNGASKVLLGQNGNSKMQALATKISLKLNLIGILLTQQCNRVAALRLRRAYQILLLYRRIYGEQLLMQKIRTNVQRKGRPLLALLSATLFQWENERISDEDLQRCREEMEEVHTLIERSHNPKNTIETCTDLNEWEQLVDRDDFKIWRRRVTDSHLFQYRVFGHFTDIPPKAFYNTQVDVGYWKDWDRNTLEVKIIDRDEITSSEVVHWLYKFPYPMYPREYVYVRRCKADSKSNTMVISANATEHPSCPTDGSSVRVATYCSQMVIKPYTTFDENGFDYVMTYCDDPQTNFPTVCYNWMASTGVHEFLEKVHRAARKKHERSSESSTTRIDNSQDSIYTKMAHH